MISPRGVLKFSINAGLNTLPSLDNLKRWGKRVSDRYAFCGNTRTVLHTLLNCNIALDQGRYSWRHGVLSIRICLIHPILVQDLDLFSDLPGFLAPGGGSIHTHVLATNQRPDIFLVNDFTCEAIFFLADMSVGWQCRSESCV